MTNGEKVPSKSRRKEIGLWRRIMGRREIVLYIFTLAVFIGFLVTKSLSENNFMALATLVIGFYFGQRSNPQNK